MKIDFKGGPAGVSLVEEAVGPTPFAAEGQPGSRSGEQMLPQGLFIMASGQFSSPCPSDQGKSIPLCCFCTHLDVAGQARQCSDSIFWGFST